MGIRSLIGCLIILETIAFDPKAAFRNRQSLSLPILDDAFVHMSYLQIKNRGKWFHLDHIHMGVSKNSGTPKSSILIGFSIINHPFGGPPHGTPIFGNIHMLVIIFKQILQPSEFLLAWYGHEDFNRPAAFMPCLVVRPPWQPWKTSSKKAAKASAKSRSFPRRQ